MEGAGVDALLASMAPAVAPGRGNSERAEWPAHLAPGGGVSAEGVGAALWSLQVFRALRLRRRLPEVLGVEFRLFQVATDLQLTAGTHRHQQIPGGPGYNSYGSRLGETGELPCPN